MSIFTVVEQGTATDADDLLSKLRVFAVANGFTEVDYKAGARSGSILSLSRNGVYFNLKSYVNDAPFSSASAGEITDWQASLFNDGIVCSLSNAYDALEPWDEQEGFETKGAPILQTDANILSYDFFYNGSVIYIACQYLSGKYSHMCLGDVTKFGVYEKCGFVSATYKHDFNSSGLIDPLNDHVRPCIYAATEIDTGDIPRAYTLVNMNNTVTTVHGNVGHYDRNVLQYMAGFDYTYDVKNSNNSFLGGKGTFLKGMFLANMDIDGGVNHFLPVGTVDGVFVAYFQNYSVKEVVNIGTRYYVCIPFYQKPSPWVDTDRPSGGLGVIIEVNASYVP